MKVILKQTFIKSFDLPDDCDVDDIANMYEDADIVMDFNPYSDNLILEANFVEKDSLGFQEVFNEGYGNDLI